MVRISTNHQHLCIIRAHLFPEVSGLDPIMMGEYELGVSKSNKYLGDWINEHGTLASILETIENDIWTKEDY